MSEADVFATIGDVAGEPVAQSGPAAQKDFTYVDIGSVDRDAKVITEGKKLAASEAPSRARQVLKAGDVLVSMTRPNLNAVAHVPATLDGAIGSTGFHVLRSQWMAPGFLYYLVQTTEFVDAMSSAVQGALYPAVRPADIAKFRFRLPPRAEQTRIIEKLEELLGNLDAAVADLKAAQRKLACYRQSLLKAAVEGTLTAQWRTARTSSLSFPRRRESSFSGVPAEQELDAQTQGLRKDARLRGNDGKSETGPQLLQRILQERRARWEDKQRAKFEQTGKTPPKGWQAKYPEPAAPDTNDLPALPEGWAWASVDQVAADEAYALAIGPFGSNLVVSDYREVGVPLVFVRNIRSKNYGNGITKFVTAEKANELKAHHVAPGDVLVTKMGEPPGEADVYPSGHPSAVITADCIKIRPQQGLMDAYFLAAAINSPLGIRQIKPMTQGVAQKKVSLGRFSTFAVPLPPLEEQTQIITTLETQLSAAKEQDAALARALHQAAAQRRNLLTAAFAGQLVPQDPADEPASELLARIHASKADNAGRTRAARNAK